MAGRPVPRFYEDRAFHDGFVDQVYAEFEALQVADRYAGMSIRVMDGRYRRADEIKRDLPRGRLPRAAKELVDLVLSRVPTREDLPQTRPSPTPNMPSIPARRNFTVDPAAAPNLANHRNRHCVLTDGPGHDLSIRWASRLLGSSLVASQQAVRKSSRSWLPVLRAAAVPAFNEVLFVTVESGSWVTRRIAGGAPRVDS